MEYINSELDGLWDRVDDLKESISDISGEMEYLGSEMREKIEEVENDN